MARYSVGQKIIAVSFVSDERDIYFPKMPYLYDNAPVTIQVVELEVTEHHKVRWEYDNESDEAKYDGFILKDKEGGVWYNQYPRADYGQVTDWADRVFTIHSDGKNTPLKELISQYEKDTKSLSYQLFEDAYERIYRGIDDLKKLENKEPYLVEKTRLLEELIPQLDAILLERGLKAERKPIWEGAKVEHIKRTVLVPL